MLFNLPHGLEFETRPILPRSGAPEMNEVGPYEPLIVRPVRAPTGFLIKISDPYSPFSLIRGSAPTILIHSLRL